MIEKDKVDPKGKDDGGITTDEEDDKPQDGNKNPASVSVSNVDYLILDEYNKAFADHKRIREDTSISEEERKVLLAKSKLRVDASIRTNWARNSALALSYEASVSTTAVSASKPKSNAQASASESKDNTQTSSSNVDEDWPSLGATFDRAANQQAWRFPRHYESSG